MKSVELNLYRHDFNVASSQSTLNRILRSILVPIISVGLILLLPFSFEIRMIIFIGILLGGIFIVDKYLRRIFTDWPNSKKYVGTINFSKDLIIIKEGVHVTKLSLSDCSELVIFIDHYTGFRSVGADLERNGNGLFFFKDNLGQTRVYKFNIFNENQFKKIKIILDEYKDSVSYFKEYLPFEIPHILKPDLSDRLNY